MDLKSASLKAATFVVQGVLEAYESGIEFFIYLKEKEIRSFLPIFPDWENSWDGKKQWVEGFVHFYETASDLYGLLCYMKQFQTKGNSNLWVKINRRRWEMKDIPFFYFFKKNEGWSFGIDVSNTEIAKDPRLPINSRRLCTTNLEDVKCYVEVASQFLNLSLIPLTIKGCLTDCNYKYLYHAMLGFQVSFAEAHAQLMKMKFPP